MSPVVPDDALSEVLKSIRLEGAVFLNAEFSAPWCLRGRYGMASVRERLGGAEHVVFFHFIVEGQAKIRLADSREVIEAAEGDLLLFAQDDRHLMGSDLHLAPLDTEDFDHRSRPVAPDAEPVHLRHGGGGALTRVVCGYLACSRGMLRPILDVLPRGLRISLLDAPALLRELLRMGVRESQAARPGAEATLAKIAELMFVEALRRYAHGTPSDGKGLLAALRDAQIGRALALLHGAPARNWTVDELARKVALSRSALAEKFSALMGEPPIQYLTRWRLALAARSLRAGSEAIVRVAESSGYESEAAFSRAFKREFGLPPAAWRRAALASA